MDMVYTSESSKCFTNGSIYHVVDCDDPNYFITYDNQGDGVYVPKSNFY